MDNHKKVFTLAEVFSPHTSGIHKAAFTLAEVLITLGIIGVVAAITLPTVISNVQEYTYKKQLKKAYSELSNVALKMADDYQVDTFQEVLEIESSNYGESGTLVPYTHIAVFHKYLKVITSGLNNGSHWECWSSSKNQGGGLIGSESSSSSGVGYKYLNGNDSGYWILGYAPSACFVMPDYIFAMDANTSLPGRISIDVNGKKKPNIIGKDIFVININNLRKIIPAGALGFMDVPDNACNKDAIKGGPACTAKYLLE